MYNPQEDNVAQEEVKIHESINNIIYEYMIIIMLITLLSIIIIKYINDQSYMFIYILVLLTVIAIIGAIQSYRCKKIRDEYMTRADNVEYIPLDTIRTL